ncbi:hypothetical protein F5146DRAFT_1038491 [Armillaria mellea]|nr:hypothetical protein F5146DRAFT_1038491 [Armillaria mellea]
MSGPLWVWGRVCGLWRDTLHSSPASWARKLVVTQPFSKHAPEILQTYLEHTGEHPLSLHIGCPEPIKDDIILSLLVQSYQRWKKLRIITIKHHMRHFESISHFPALQAIDIQICDDDNYHSDMSLNAPQLWQAILRTHRLHQIKLPPGITHFSGSITCPEDVHRLSQLPKLRRCYLWMDMDIAGMEAPVVTVARLTHLYVNRVGILKFLSAPLLSSLTISRIIFEPVPARECVIGFLRRSRCRLESLSIGGTFIPGGTLALEA